jgi:hypothetical protein
MRSALVLVGGAWVALLCALAPACGSSGGNSDGGHDAAADRTPDSVTDVAAEKPECMGLDAEAMGLTFAPACLTCIGTYCCEEAKPCAGDEECKQILQCESVCTAHGNAAMDCAIGCIVTDGKDAGGEMTIPPDAKLNSTQNAAETLDVCIAGHCSSECGK